MARKKQNNAGTVIILIVIAILVLIAIATPVVIIIGYFYNKIKVADIRKNLAGTMADFWLEDNEKHDFKEKVSQLSNVEQIIQQANDEGEHAGVNRNQDNTFSSRSKLGKELKATISKYEPIKVDLIGFLQELQSLPISRWEVFNNYVRNCKSFLFSLCSWVTTLVFYSITLEKQNISEVIMPYYALATNFFRDEGGTIPIVDGDLKMVAIATITAIASYFLFRMIFANAAEKYSPKPGMVTLENIDTY